MVDGPSAIDPDRAADARAPQGARTLNFRAVMRYRPVGPRRNTHFSPRGPLDATQTSEPTEAGPGSAPGQAAAYRRVLDDQALTDGPLDLTVPLNIAEVRAALATTGPLRRVGLAAYVAASKSASVSSARPHDGHAGGGGSHRRRIAQLPSRRLGRIFAFVAVAAALSVGTAWALVLSNNTQNTSVSLPATGAIPMAPSAKNPQPGQAAGNSGSTSAQATPSLSHSAAGQAPVPAPTKSATPTSRATPTPDPSASAGGSASASAPVSTPPGFGPGPTSTSTGQWVVLVEGANENAQEVQETTNVQGLLLELGYLASWHHRSFVDPDRSPSADASGHYGPATAEAVSEFQQYYNVSYTSQLGQCDAATYQLLVEIVNGA